MNVLSNKKLGIVVMITVQPSNPSADTPVSFTFTGGSPCPVTTQTIEGTEFIFEVRDSTENPCLGTPLPYTFTWNVGTLAAGDYQVTHIDPRMPTETQSFVVAQGTQTSPESIPATGLGATIVLAALLSLLAAKSLNRIKARDSR
ncbi:MAG TPA: hypothetical protein VJ902_07785 [Wenzhouxiangellaceae bacterium]|nr:hypothetical protein [Wenzhouxiangellaceae bacterium]HKL53843.1 hypothetical protein [Wenzhouxiangellaceae bacterium]